MLTSRQQRHSATNTASVHSTRRKGSRFCSSKNCIFNV